MVTACRGKMWKVIVCVWPDGTATEVSGHVTRGRAAGEVRLEEISADRGGRGVGKLRCVCRGRGHGGSWASM